MFVPNHRNSHSKIKGGKKRVVHAFLSVSFSLKPLDIEFMKRLHDKVNVIPLIAKADTLTPEECQLFKKQVRVHMWRFSEKEL